MHLKKLGTLGFIVTALFLFSENTQSYSGNPPEVIVSMVKGKTVQTCNSCHGTGKLGLIPETGGITIDYEGGDGYESAKSYTIDVTIDTANNRHGFQMVALDHDNKGVGEFTKGNNGQRIEKDAVDQVSHISHDNIPNTNDATFSFSWKGPETYKDTVRFFVIAVAANGNKQTTGDKVYFTSKSITYKTLGSVLSADAKSIELYPTIVADYLTLKLSNNTGTIAGLDLVGANGTISKLDDVSALHASNNLIQIQRPTNLSPGWYLLRIRMADDAALYRRVFMQ